MRNFCDSGFTIKPYCKTNNVSSQPLATVFEYSEEVGGGLGA